MGYRGSTGPPGPVGDTGEVGFTGGAGPVGIPGSLNLATKTTAIVMLQTFTRCTKLKLTLKLKLK